MTKGFDVRWAGTMAGTPGQVWDAITVHCGGWQWPAELKPSAGGDTGPVKVWEPLAQLTISEPDRDGVNQLDFVLEPAGTGTYLRYRHRGLAEVDTYDVEVDACRKHTDFYYHSLCEYVAHFAGRDAVYVTADGPASSASGGSAAVRRALGLDDDLAPGDPVRLTPAGMDPIDGVVDYTTDAFLGVRTEDALYRFYCRDVWGWPVSVAHHLFGEGVDGSAEERAWSAWLNSVFPS